MNSSSLSGILHTSSRLWLLALALLLALLKLSEPARPRVPPLDDQAAFVCDHAALAGGVLVIPQQQVLLPGLDLGAFTGHVFGPDPQKLVPAADAALALLVDGDDVDGEFPPLADFVRLQDVHLHSVIFLAVLFHVDFQLAFRCLAVRVTVGWLLCAAGRGRRRRNRNLYAGRNGRAALLVAFSTAVARDTSHAVFTGTLSCGLVTGFASCTHGMAIACFAGLPV